MTRRARIVVWSGVALIALLVVAAGLVVSITQTEYGQRQVRNYIQSWLNGKVRGKFYVGKISGGLFRGVTIDSVDIRDEMDSLLVASGPIKVNYDIRDLW